PTEVERLRRVPGLVADGWIVVCRSLDRPEARGLRSLTQCRNRRVLVPRLREHVGEPTGADACSSPVDGRATATTIAAPMPTLHVCTLLSPLLLGRRRHSPGSPARRRKGRPVRPH